MTYEVGGVQYVAVMAGFGGGDLLLPFPEGSAPQRYGNEGRIIALRLDGGAVPLRRRSRCRAAGSPRPAWERAQIAAGEVLYNRYCSRCHVFGQPCCRTCGGCPRREHACSTPSCWRGAVALGMGVRTMCESRRCGCDSCLRHRTNRGRRGRPSRGNPPLRRLPVSGAI